MTVSAEHLNRVRDYAVSRNCSKEAAISMMILLLHAKFGYTLDQAHDAVLGQGSYVQMISDLYSALNARQA
jgi:hypothetical protein